MSTEYQPMLCIDSGAFSAWASGGKVDLDAYIAFCQDLTRRAPTAHYVNLDVIGDGEASYQNYRTMVRSGLDPMPVYHMNTDPKWLVKYLQHTDYVGLGAMAKLPGSKRVVRLDRVWEDYLIDRATRMPKVKVHAMAVTAFTLIHRYPWYSVDSTSWLLKGAFGRILVPRLSNGQWDYTRQPYEVDVSLKSGALGSKKHIRNFTPHNRAIILRYLQENGFGLGKSHLDEKGKVVAEEYGVENDSARRFCVNCLFYARFVHTQPWPRPFAAAKPQGLFA